MKSFHKTLNLFVSVLTLLTFSLANIQHSSASPVVADKAKNVAENAYAYDFNRIERFRSLHDLPAMEKTCDELLYKWKGEDPKSFVELSCGACEVLSSVNFHNIKQFTLAQKYALAALESSAPKSTNDQACLVMYGLSHDLGQTTVGSTSWIDRRKNIARWWFTTWQRINQGIDPNFDPKAHHYQVNVAPPADAHQLVFSGMSPTSIKDPAVRHEYEQAIKRNRETIQLVNQQHDLRDLKRTFEFVAKHYIIQAYTTPPFESSELDNFLKSYVDNDVTRQYISDAVNKATIAH